MAPRQLSSSLRFSRLPAFSPPPSNCSALTATELNITGKSPSTYVQSSWHRALESNLPANGPSTNFYKYGGATAWGVMTARAQKDEIMYEVGRGAYLRSKSSYDCQVGIRPLISCIPLISQRSSPDDISSMNARLSTMEGIVNTQGSLAIQV